MSRKRLNTLNAAVLLFLICNVVFINAYSYLNRTLSQEETIVYRSDNKIRQFINYAYHLMMIGEYHFFSPNVSDSFVMELSEINDLNEEHSLPTVVRSKEMVNRLHTAYYHFCQKEFARDAFAHSFAVNSFEQNPQISQLYLRFHLYKLPSMKEYRAGKEPHLELIYHNQFHIN